MTIPQTQRIAIDDLTIGMYLVGLDQSWLHSPFLFHRRRIGSRDDIARLKAYGVRHVTIDPSRGLRYAAPQPLAVAVLAEEPVGTPAERAEVPLLPTGLVPPVEPLPDLALARTVHAEVLTAVQGLFEGVNTGTPIKSGGAREVVHTLMETVLHRHAALASLIHMRHFEANLYTHATNVCVFALMLGSLEALDLARLEWLGLGALLHDIGQVYLPRNLVRKPGLYTPQERRLMQAHPQLGATVVSQAAHMPAEVCRIVAEHHESPDGSGYPGALTGPSLSSLSQIVAIADVYESMLGPRAARPPLLPGQAVKELYQRGRTHQLDLTLVERMVRCLGLYPVGSLVELYTGERGIVTAVNPDDALRPTVTVLWDAAQQRYATPLTVPLSTLEAQAQPVICRVLDPVAEGYDLVTFHEESRGS